MANITTTEAAVFIPEIWAARALGYLKSNTVMARLVNRRYQDAIANAGDIVNIQERGALTVSTKAANTAVTLQTPSGTNKQVTMVHKYISFLVEDIAEAQANQSVIGGYIEDGVKKIAEDVDAALLALYTGFSATPIDGVTGGLAVADITEADRVLNAAKVPSMDRAIAWGPDAQAELLQIAQFTSANEAPANATALENATLGRKFGFNNVMDQNTVETGGEVKNLAFHRDAIALVTRRLPDPPADSGARAATFSEDGFAVRVLWGYNMSHMGVQVNIDLLYGAAELRDNHAVVIRSADV